MYVRVKCNSCGQISTMSDICQDDKCRVPNCHGRLKNYSSEDEAKDKARAKLKEQIEQTLREYADTITAIDGKSIEYGCGGENYQFRWVEFSLGSFRHRVEWEMYGGAGCSKYSLYLVQTIHKGAEDYEHKRHLLGVVAGWDNLIEIIGILKSLASVED